MRLFAQQCGPMNYGINIDGAVIANGLTFEEADKAIRIGQLIAEKCGQKIELCQENIDFYREGAVKD